MRIRVGYEMIYDFPQPEGLRLWAQTGSRIFRPICLAFLAEAYAADHKLDLARRTFEEAMQGVQPEDRDAGSSCPHSAAAVNIDRWDNKR